MYFWGNPSPSFACATKNLRASPLQPPNPFQCQVSSSVFSLPCQKNRAHATTWTPQSAPTSCTTQTILQLWQPRWWPPWITFNTGVVHRDLKPLNVLLNRVRFLCTCGLVGHRSHHTSWVPSPVVGDMLSRDDISTIFREVECTSRWT